MADNTTLNTMTGGDVVAADDIGGVKHQRIKLIHGIDGTNDGDVSNTNPFPVSARQPQLWYETDVPGYNTVAYTAGDQLGTLITIANAARATGGGGWINSILYHDDDNVMGAIDVLFFNDTPTLALNNAAFAITDADARKLLYIGNMTYVTALGAQRYGQLAGLSVPYFCTGTSLYVALITRTTPTLTGTVTQRIRFGLTRD